MGTNMIDRNNPNFQGFVALMFKAKMMEFDRTGQQVVSEKGKKAGLSASLVATDKGFRVGYLSGGPVRKFLDMMRRVERQKQIVEQSRKEREKEMLSRIRELTGGRISFSLDR